jgi:hypothetical protein
LVYGWKFFYPLESSMTQGCAEDVAMLLGALRKETLSRELQDVTAALRIAESAGDSEEAARLTERSRVLTTAIAKQHETR